MAIGLERGKLSMRLTKEEKEICKQYSKRDENNTVHCYECPLVINRTWTLCKANCRVEEWREYLAKTD